MALAADADRRAAVAAFDNVRAEQKALGKQIGPLQGQLKKASDDVQRATLQQEVDALMAKASELAEAVKATEQTQREADEAADRALSALSNVVDPAAPVGGEDDFVVIEEVGSPRDFGAEDLSRRITSNSGSSTRPSMSSAARRCQAAALLLDRRRRPTRIRARQLGNQHGNE